jgi:glycosyltransferase involved in cell wall biosynthesis
MNPPVVTIGLPVFNGENFLAQAIDSVLVQTYTDFELIIRDNASTDRTEEICRAFSKRDSRIRYIRNSRNIGAGPNFNGLVELAQGRYFKWLAHDDLMAPSFLASCIDALEAAPKAALSCPRVRFIDAHGNILDDYISPYQTACHDRTVRFGEMLKGGHRCFEIFGLIRLSRLKETRLLGNYNNGDGVLLANIALQGPLLDIPDFLYLSRRHSMSSMYVFRVTGPNRSPDLEGYANWFDPNNKVGLSFSFNKALSDYLWMIWSVKMSPIERWRCHRIVIGWLSQHWRSLAGEWKRAAFHLGRLPFRSLLGSKEQTPDQLY